MRTTLDLPDDLYRQLKAKAALQGITVRTFVRQAVEDKMHISRKRDVPIPFIESTRKKKINPTRKQLEEALFG